MAIYDAKPSKYEAVGNGSYLYRWNIEEIQVPDNSDSETTVSKWQCEEVTVWSPVTANKITKAVITSKWDNNYEQKLANDYNAAKLGIYGADDSIAVEERITAYTGYLSERKALKEQVDADCAELGIL